MQKAIKRIQCWAQWIFPQKDVRFIAIGNNYDSVRAEKDGTDMLLPFLNVFNEFHNIIPPHNLCVYLKFSNVQYRFDSIFMYWFA